MKLLSNKAHGVLDYASVYILLVSPYFLEMKGPATNFSWALAFVHLALTLLTDFKLGFIKIIPLKLHAKIELIVSPVLTGVAVYFFNAGDRAAAWFYFLFSVMLFLIWYNSGYDTATEKSSDSNKQAYEKSCV